MRPESEKASKEYPLKSSLLGLVNTVINNLPENIKNLLKRNEILDPSKRLFTKGLLSLLATPLPKLKTEDTDLLSSYPSDNDDYDAVVSESPLIEISDETNIEELPLTEYESFAEIEKEYTNRIADFLSEAIFARDFNRFANNFSTITTELIETGKIPDDFSISLGAIAENIPISVIISKEQLRDNPDFISDMLNKLSVIYSNFQLNHFVIKNKIKAEEENELERNLYSKFSIYRTERGLPAINCNIVDDNDEELLSVYYNDAINTSGITDQQLVPILNDNNINTVSEKVDSEIYGKEEGFGTTTTLTINELKVLLQNIDHQNSIGDLPNTLNQKLLRLRQEISLELSAITKEELDELYRAVLNVSSDSRADSNISLRQYTNPVEHRQAISGIISELNEKGFLINGYDDQMTQYNIEQIKGLLAIEQGNITIQITPPNSDGKDMQFENSILNELGIGLNDNGQIYKMGNIYKDDSLFGPIKRDSQEIIINFGWQDGLIEPDVKIMHLLNLKIGTAKAEIIQEISHGSPAENQITFVHPNDNYFQSIGVRNHFGSIIPELDFNTNNERLGIVLPSSPHYGVFSLEGGIGSPAIMIESTDELGGFLMFTNKTNGQIEIPLTNKIERHAQGNPMIRGVLPKFDTAISSERVPLFGAYNPDPEHGGYSGRVKLSNTIDKNNINANTEIVAREDRRDLIQLEVEKDKKDELIRDLSELSDSLNDNELKESVSSFILEINNLNEDNFYTIYLPDFNILSWIINNSDNNFSKRFLNEYYFKSTRLSHNYLHRIQSDNNNTTINIQEKRDLVRGLGAQGGIVFKYEDNQSQFSNGVGMLKKGFDYMVHQLVAIEQEQKNNNLNADGRYGFLTYDGSFTPNDLMDSESPFGPGQIWINEEGTNGDYANMDGAVSLIGFDPIGKKVFQITTYGSDSMGSLVSKTVTHLMNKYTESFDGSKEELRSYINERTFFCHCDFNVEAGLILNPKPGSNIVGNRFQPHPDLHGVQILRGENDVIDSVPTLYTKGNWPIVPIFGNRDHLR